ncbi:MAG TPA: asparaginase, partial [Terrimesophilobacter sp.]|nr:asparaginase [Terrimesophilobacter sp.]
PNTIVIEQLGLVTKMGADGVLVAAADDGTSVAVKVLDGSARVTYAVALELLSRVDAISRADAERVTALTTERVLGGGEPVGAVRIAF